MVNRPTGIVSVLLKKYKKQALIFEASIINQTVSSRVIKKISKCSVKEKKKTIKSHPCQPNLFDL